MSDFCREDTVPTRNVVLTEQQAAMIERLVQAGLLKRDQATPRAPWEIRRADLDAEPIRSIVERLLRTGKLILQGECADKQPPLFTENKGDDNGRHHE